VTAVAAAPDRTRASTRSGARDNILRCCRQQSLPQQVAPALVASVAATTTQPAYGKGRWQCLCRTSPMRLNTHWRQHAAATLLVPLAALLTRNTRQAAAMAAVFAGAADAAGQC